MANLVGQPEALRKYALGVLTGQIDEDFRPALGNGKIYIDMVVAHGPTVALDLSYMLILELRDFYYQRYHAFVKCRTSCQQICDIAHRLCVKLDPALQDIYNYTQSFGGASSGGGRMKLEASYAAKELAYMHGIICLVFHKVRLPISLIRFKDGPSIYQVDAPGYPTVHLRAILDVIVKKFHKTTVSVTTATTADGNLCTTIDGTTFRRRYKPAKPMPLFEYLK
ncbi:uncharacterized protein [Miscanthus floridulus]|uniref:uncharacterized protein isoform X3 n=1 Tax=Miscanthus floridulus TaxID=154761 RepID=UPI003458E83E